ncbi:disease resistance protein Roq1-like [Syzygium oleosum]|uniref:disease resistance protein Roq1-like n=1 Tax=Syzygium oleosum TaxID=219896 RepID=UPI0024B9B08C|nr:disease resistance protein Roq1-like [Syzygium oleosum]
MFVFRDDNSLHVGEGFGSRLLDAITWADILMPIISENCASIEVAKQLKVLNFAFCHYAKCSQDFSAITELEILSLKKYHGLMQVHPSIGKVKNLVSLGLSSCVSLKELPGEVGELEELKELILDFASITKILIQLIL